jgi:serine/threonine-protein kinase RsbW
MDRQDAVETGDREDLQDRFVRACDGHVAAGLPCALQAGDDRAEAARVHERDARKVHEDATRAVGQQVVEASAQRRGRAEIDVSGDVDDVPSLLGAVIKLDVDGGPPSLGRPSRDGRLVLAPMLEHPPSDQSRTDTPPDGRRDSVTITVPARAEFLHVVRAVVGSVAAKRDLTVDAIEDLRIAVDEACAQLLVARGTDVTVRIAATDDGVAVVCSTDADVAQWPPEGIEHTLAAQVLQGLADEVTWERDGAGPAVRVVKRGVAATAR